MAIRTVNGNTSTEDGWPLVDQAGCTWITIPGTIVHIQVQSGLPARALGAWEADWNAYVEPLEDDTTGCWTESNSVLGGFGQNNGSNHLGGTAVDTDWERHPMGPHAPDDQRAGFSAAQVNTLRDMIAFYTFTAKDGTVIQIVWWANDWNTPHDSMHSQMGYDTYDYRDEVQAWCDTHIRPDGFSTFRRGAMPTVDTGAVLAEAMGDREGVDYAAMAPLFAGFLDEADCTTVLRIAMAAAQLGEESGGLEWMEEIADGSEYEGRADLGNTEPGDGPRFKGRGPIQLTGRHNYGAFSIWVHDRYPDMCPSPTHFVDHPELVSNYDIGFLAAAYYWVSHNLNSYADKGDVLGATKVINGGTHGLSDRQNRYNNCMNMGQRLLALLTIGDDELSAEAEQMISEIHDELFKRGPSRAGVAEDGKDIETLLGYIYNIDGNVWDARLMMPYLLDVPYAVEQVERVAAGGPAPDSWAASNEFVKEFATEVCKALVEFKPKWQALFDPPKKTTVKK